ncbi:HIT-like protein [Tothia fuscella]|uniref:HIT-like protein n=1 Tax=Tothia fuscella TaxID=1048955 RepID=A0A9P4NF83_9PEZI|nr:HIT-like protein [Tothia fuscella]
MANIDELYPQSCPFCSIATAYPAAAASTTDLTSAIPKDGDGDAEKVQPACFLVLSAPDVMAFLDILPMTRGHLLVTVRKHKEKIADVDSKEGQDIGKLLYVKFHSLLLTSLIGFWLPILARAVTKVTGVNDYNLVQNNGARAAQVVPHVHFHIIPRPSDVPQLQNKSWTMFGRGQREELDDDEAKVLAAELRAQIRKEVQYLDEDRKSKL